MALSPTSSRGSTFNGGTIATGLAVSPVSGAASTPPLVLNAASDQTSTADRDLLVVYSSQTDNHLALLDIESNGSFTSSLDAAHGGTFLVLTVQGATLFTLTAAGAMGFFGAAPVAKPTVTGAKLPSDVVLASLLTALVALGLVVDSST